MKSALFCFNKADFVSKKVASLLDCLFSFSDAKNCFNSVTNSNYCAKIHNINISETSQTNGRMILDN